MATFQIIYILYSLQPVLSIGNQNKVYVSRETKNPTLIMETEWYSESYCKFPFCWKANTLQ